jgi:hypothetical protein
MGLHRFSTSTRPIDPGALAARMEQLRSDASAAASEHTGVLVAMFEDASVLAEQVANGGEAYHVGVREIARRSHIELAAAVLNLRSITRRV